MTIRRSGILLAMLAIGGPSAWPDKRVDEAVAKADQQVQRGHPEEAIKTLDRLAAQVPSSESYLALARLQSRLGNLDEAATAAGKASELAASAATTVRSDVFATQSGLTLQRGPGQQALTQAQEAVKAQETPTSLAALATAQVRTQQAPAALQTADKAVQLGASSAVAHLARGEALLALGRTADAEAAMRKALELDGKLTGAKVGLGRALLAAGKPAEAVPLLRKTTEEDPKSGEAFAVLGTAILAENKDHWQDAIAQAQQGAFLSAKNPSVQLAVGRIFEGGSNLEQATAAYRRALDADPGYAPARVGLILAQFRRGEIDPALAEAQKLVAETPGSAEGQLLLGRLLLRKEDYAGATKALEQATTLGSGSAEAQALYGTALWNVRRTADALAAYRKAVDLAPNNSDFRTTYGLLLGLNKQHEAGITELKKVVATPGYKDPDAWINLGWLYRSIEPRRVDDSVAAYRKALEVDPKNEQAALGLGWAYSYKHDWDQSIAAFQKAMELDPKTTGEANNGIAWAYLFKKELPKAREYMEKARAAGRNDVRLSGNIEKAEKGQQAAEEVEAPTEAPVQKSAGPDVGSVSNTLLNSPDTGARRRAAQSIVQFGGGAVNPLLNALIKEKNRDVKTQIVNSLAALNAKAAAPYLRRILETRKDEPIVQTPEQMQESQREEEYRRAVRDALLKIEGGR
jgi:tetratricopeptide (TPR) repeat protein